MKIHVKHQKATHVIDLPEDATFALLQQTLHEKFLIMPRKQRLLFAGAAGRQMRGNNPESHALLRHSGVTDGAHVMLLGNKEPRGVAAKSDAVEQRSTERRYADVDRLVIQRHHAEHGLFSCSFSLGYVCQKVFVCRTCVSHGNADPRHVLCAGCAEVCHAGHRVEHWGVRLNVRCDCCTATFDVAGRGAALVDAANARAEGGAPDATSADAADVPPPPACSFIVDETTNQFPQLRLEPNDGNTYPPTSDGLQIPIADATDESGSAATAVSRWCACGWEREDRPRNVAEVDHTNDPRQQSQGSNSSADDDEAADDDDGACEACIICGAGYWAGHLTNMDVDWLYHVGCYGEVRGQVVVFHCYTCGVDCCLPCRLHCHVDHECGPADLFSSEDDPASPVFGCGCRGQCAIAERVEPEVAVAARARAMERGLFKSSNFDAAEDVVEADGKCVASVIARADVTCDTFVHFVCEPCLAKYQWLLDKSRLVGCLGPDAGSVLDASPRGGAVPTCARVPAATANGDASRHGAVLPSNLFSELVCQCDTCQDAYKLRLLGCASMDAPIDLHFSTTRVCTNCRETVQGTGFVCVNCELAGSESLSDGYLLCGECYERRDELAHDPTHNFAEDSGGNLFSLFSATFAQHLSAEEQLWMVDHWQEAQGMFLDYVQSNFGSRRLRDCDGTSSDGTSTMRSARSRR